jgi:PEP-CTERM motif
MRNFCLSLLLGLTTMTTVSTPLMVCAASFDYSKIKNFSARPIDSDNTLTLFGDISQKEGYTALNNLNPNAPDAGHVSIAKNALPGNSVYYVTGRENSPLSEGATRSASVNDIEGFSNFFNYLNSNNISPNEIGFGFGQKSGLDFTKSWNLGEDKLGQDWFASQDSTIEERIYRANPEEVEQFLYFGNTKIVSFGYTDIYFATDNGATPLPNDNFNVFLSDPTPALKVAGLDPLASGLADAFLQDVAAGGGFVQQVSEDPNIQFNFSVSNGYAALNLNLPLELRVVQNTSIPEPASILGLLTLGAFGIVSRLDREKQQK